MKKRMLSILLLCCMVLTMLPTAAFAADKIDEQFNLAPGGVYYFDLSAMGIPGTVNDALPDKTMRYVPFTYAGTVAAYKLTSEMATTEEYAETYKYAHSLFIADFAVTHEVSWDELNTADLIFGKDCAAGGVEYMLRAPSVGSGSTGSGESKRGTPQSNEWDRILDKNDGYIKNWSGIYSWGQDTSSSSWTIRVNRGAISARFWTGSRPANSRQTLGFRPVLEILNPGTLGSDGLKAVTLDLGGGKLGNSFKDIQIIVKSGDAFTAPSGDGLTRPDGNIGSYFKWLGSDGELYAPGESVPAVVTKLSAQFSLPEQFTLTPGSTYYFDLSGVGIPGTANGSLPDASLHYVPFTYAGTVDAYKLTSEMVTTEEYAEQNQYPHSLFVADFAVTHTVNWNALNDASLIFGKNYAAGGVDYMLRAPSAGSDSTGSGDSEHGTPQSNEWDRILDKNGGYIKNWGEMFSCGQDTASEDASFRAVRGYFSALYWISYATTDSAPNLGFSPVLEVLNPGTLGSDGLKVVTLDLGGGKLGSNSDHIQIIVKKGESFTAPASNGLTRPDGNTGSYFKWLGSDGKLYVPGGSVPANVNKLTAQFDYTEQFTLDPGGTYYFDLSGVNIPGTVNDALPDKTMHYVPFTYAGTVDAYKLTSEMVTTEEYAAQNKFAHSLFMADYAVTHTVSWNDLNTADLIFGKDCAADGVEYMLRAPSVGSGGTGWDDLERATPQSNEWDKTLDKYDGYIKNWSWMHSWGQDTESIFASGRAVRGYGSARGWYDDGATVSSPRVGFRPVLEVLNPGTLGSDGLKAVTIDLGGGKLGNSSEDIQIIVKNGKSFTAPASEGLTRPDGNTGNYFKWRGSDGELYAPDDNVPADVTKLTAQFDEQFTLAPGGTYYFDLSGESIPGTADDALPDKTMHYVPFTYAGTVDAYKLTSAMAATDEYAEKNKYAHSLFVADYTVTHTVSWDELNAGRLIFGRDYAAGGVDYILRAPSVGSGSIGSAESQRGTPPSNEWDRILDKNDGYIKNWFGMFSWGQDTLSTSESDRAARGYFPPGGWSSAPASHQNAVAGFRPVLEILSPGSLGSDGLKAVTLDLGGGKLGNNSEDIQIIVKSGESFAAPASDGLTRPDGNTDNYFKWLGSDGELYEPGDNVSADVTKLTAQFNLPEQFTLAPGGTYYFDLSGAGIPGTANDALPDATLHYVPFTYAGMVNAYKLTSAMQTTEEYAEKNKYDHSLFVAEYNVTRAVSWTDLNTAGLIFGKDYTSDGVDYTLRAPSVGSASTGSYDLERGTPQSNEWDKILDKGSGYIKNWEGMDSWGQDIMEDWDVSAHRGYMSARHWNCSTDTSSQLYYGFRPVLEVLGLDTLGADGLKAVTLDLGSGKLGDESSIQIIVETGSAFTAPASDGLTRPDGNTGSYFMWLGSDGKLYDPGDNVPADVTKLTAQFASSSHSVTITTDTLPDGKVGEAYSQILTATGTKPITWSIENGDLPADLSLNKDTGEISGTPTADGTAKFTVKAENSVGSDTKELSITITKDAPAEFTISVKTDGSGTASASLAKAAANTEITLSATPNEGYHFKEWEVESPTGLVITNNKFLMPDSDVEIKATFEEDAPPAPTDPAKPSISVTGAYTY
ncbi:InlB B-repeat-containing protein, partial [Flavonifractor plautii]|uniref:InlB B-repeat-containing protein n=1 Tax=Flavonifractor plautii TaxID=292800 RepID=UPI00232CBA16